MLRVESISKSFKVPTKSLGRSAEHASTADVHAMTDVTFQVDDGEFVTLLGPSGCGKTTTLRSIAGLESPDAGEISLDGQILFSGKRKIDVSPDARDIGMVFQSYAIWPHMNVFENVAFPLRARRRKPRLSKREVADRVSEVLDVTELGALANRPATDLSGGQQQRLALARALVTKPSLMLLDEPLSNLDASLRESMRLELKRLQQELGVTTLYVTHDQTEALALSSKIVVMNQGRVCQIGTPEDIYSKPDSTFVAEFVGTSNTFDGKVLSVDRDVCTVSTDFGDIRVPATASNSSAGGKVVVSIRPEDLRMDGAADNGWRGKVLTRVFLGDAMDHVVQVGDHALHCRSDRSSSREPGADVCLSAAPERVRLLSPDG